MCVCFYIKNDVICARKKTYKIFFYLFFSPPCVALRQTKPYFELFPRNFFKKKIIFSRTREGLGVVSRGPLWVKQKQQKFPHPVSFSDVSVIIQTALNFEYPAPQNAEFKKKNFFFIRDFSRIFRERVG